MWGNQIINLPVNTAYTYYFYLGAGGTSGDSPPASSISSLGHPQISQNGGSFSNTTNTVTFIANGWCSLSLTTTEMNTQDILIYINSTNSNIAAHHAVWLCTTAVGSGGGGSLTAAEVWDYLLTSGFTTGSIGAYIQNELATIISNQTSGSSPTLEQIQKVVQTAIITFSKE